jgi:tetratricopeptide (TPR) repeat protein
MTGEEVFDRSLNTALAVSLGQSVHLNLFPRRSLEGSLRRMKVDVLSSVDAATAIKVAERESLKLVVAPSIQSSETGYLVKVVIFDPKSGRQLRSETVEAAGRDRVLRALDEVARRLRTDLGEAASELAKQSRPIGDVVTNSLEALKAFSRGIEEVRVGRFKEAQTELRQALTIDPTFTAARGALGILEFEIFDKDAGRQHLSQAMQNLNGLTTEERYNTLAFYHTVVENDLPKAEQDWKALIDVYPDLSHAHNNLGRVYRLMGRWDDAAASFRRAIEIDPYLGISYDNLAWIYVNRLGDIDSAIALCRQLISYDEQNPSGYGYLGWAYLGKGDLEQARATFDKGVQLSRGYPLMRYYLGHAYRLQHRYDDAIRTYLDILATNPQEFQAQYLAAITYLAKGDAVQARRHFEDFLAANMGWLAKQPGRIEPHLNMSRALARIGDTRGARRMLDAALELQPEANLSLDQQIELGMTFNVLGDSQEALRRLTAAVRNGFRDYTTFKIDPDLMSLEGNPDYARLLDTIPARPRTAAAGPLTR